MQDNGFPGEIGTEYLEGKGRHLHAAYSCSLCKLCTARCPKKLPVAEMFLQFRRIAVERGEGRFKEHLPLRFFEKLGSSPVFSKTLLPAGCTAVFFPGCTLPAIRPRQTLKLFHALSQKNATLGILLDCCNKPSHDLGEQKDFLKRFSRKVALLQQKGIRRIITACPSCLQIFRRYGEGLEVSFAYTELEVDAGRVERCHDSKEKITTLPPQSYTIHDPCTVRFDVEMHQSVRRFARTRDKNITEMEHNGQHTLCCGEGAGSACFADSPAHTWTRRRTAEAGSRRVLSYCAGCTIRLKSCKTQHLLDILFPSSRDCARRARPFFTYLNRLRFKRWITAWLSNDAASV